MLDVTTVDSGRAADQGFVTAVSELVNDAYRVAEHGLWRSTAERTTVDQTVDAIHAGELVVASADGLLVGAVRVRTRDDGTAWFGALAVDPAWGGRGVGRALVDHVHARGAALGCTQVQLELLEPTPTHPHTDRLARWYRSMGYEPSARMELAAFDPATAALLLRPCEVVVCHKSLISDGAVP